MPISSRAYAGVGDLERMLAWSVAANQAHQQQQYLHVGDLVWRLYQNTVFDPAQHLRLWEDDHGELLGFAWHEEPDGIVMQIHPRLRGQGWLEPAMIAWSAALVDTNAPNYDGHLRTRIPDSDQKLVEQVTMAGFIRDEGYVSLMQRDLNSDIPLSHMPDGFSVRAVAGEDEWAARVNLHRDVWHPSRVTLDAYRRLRNAPGYQPDLDLVAVAPDGTLAAYAIGWLDSINQTGEFEPVGTRSIFRGRGIGKAVILEGLRRMVAHGATSAYVTAIGGNVAAEKLYASAGFQTPTREYQYRKPLV